MKETSPKPPVPEGVDKQSKKVVNHTSSSSPCAQSPPKSSTARSKVTAKTCPFTTADGSLLMTEHYNFSILTSLSSFLSCRSHCQKVMWQHSNPVSRSCKARHRVLLHLPLPPSQLLQTLRPDLIVPGSSQPRFSSKRRSVRQRPDQLRWKPHPNQRGEKYFCLPKSPLFLMRKSISLYLCLKSMVIKPLHQEFLILNK